MRKRYRCPASRGLGRRSAKRRQGVGLSGRMRRARAGGWQVHRARFSQTLRKVGSLRFSEGAPKKGAERKAVGNGKNETSLQTRPAAFGFRTRSKHRAYCGICAARCAGGIRTRHGLRRRDGRAKRNRRHGSSRLLRRRSRHRKHGFPRAGLQTPRNLPTPTPPLETPLGQKKRTHMTQHEKLLLKLMAGDRLTHQDAKHILEHFGYEMTQGRGSGVKFIKTGRPPIVYHVPHAVDKLLKPYVLHAICEAARKEL